jgi:hypothetical protein
VPTRKEIGLKKIAALRGQIVEQTGGYQRALDLMNDEWKQAVAGMNPEEVAARFLTFMFPWVFAEERRPQMQRTPRAADGSSPPVRQALRADGRPRRSNDSKDERRKEKRHFKRDFKKKFNKGFHKGAKPNRHAPPRG